MATGEDFELFGMRLFRFKFFILLVWVVSVFLGGFALQAQAIGELGNVRGYAWSSNVGWINFKSSSLGTWTTFDKYSPGCPFPAESNMSWGFQQKGDHIFLTDHQNFFAYDISTDPSAPVLVDKITYSSHVGSEGGLRGFAISGDYAFVAGGQFANERLYVFDISDPSSLLEVVMLNDARLKWPENVVISEDGNYAYVYVSNGNIVVIDISSPTTLTSADILNEIVNPDGQRGMAISGDYLYTSGQVHFAVRNLNPLNPLGGGGDPVNPPMVGDITSPDPNSDKLTLTYSVEVAGDYAYVTSPGQDRITVVNIFDPTNPFVVSWIQDSVALNDVANVSVVDGFAYVSRFVVPGGSQYLTVLDVANPEQLTVVSTLLMTACSGPSGMSEVVVVNDYAYVANWEHGYVIKLSYRYATSIDRATGWFSGYAWNPGTGWISFNRADTGSPPGPPGDDPCSAGGRCTAKLNIGGDNKVSGWARALSVCPSLPCNTLDSDGGWDGWIKFAGTTDLGTTYGVTWEPTTQKLKKWAWGDEVVGWTSFSCENQSVCPGASDYQVYAYLPDFAPTILITDPNNGDIVAGATVRIQADATDDIDPDGSLTVEYSIDDSGFGAPIPMSSVGGIVYEATNWDTTLLLPDDAFHTIYVRATDSVGNTAVADITVTVDNIDDPAEVTITAPNNGDIVSGPITIAADATDDHDLLGSLVVEYSIDDPLFPAPITMTYSGLGDSYDAGWATISAAEGLHRIYVRADDSVPANLPDVKFIDVTVDNFSPPDPPAAAGLTSSPNECSIPASQKLEWIYSHPDGPAITQNKFEIELKAGVSCNFSSPDVTVGDTSPLWKYPISGLTFGTTYCWRVRVEDIRGDVSAWSSPSPSLFTFVAHEYPDPNSFNWDPRFPLEGQVVTFEDCAGGCNPFDPLSLGPDIVTWDFGDGSPLDVGFNPSNPTHMYSAVGPNTVKLTLRDDLLVDCSETRTLEVILPFPGWREISPF